MKTGFQGSTGNSLIKMKRYPSKNHTGKIKDWVIFDFEIILVVSADRMVCYQKPKFLMHH